MALTKIQSGGLDSGAVDSTAAVANDAISADDIASGAIQGSPHNHLGANAVVAGTIANDAVGVAQLSASGTAGNTTYLRGDNSWQEVQEAITWTLGINGGADAYTFTGDGFASATDNPKLYLSRGHTYKFVNGNASGTHAFNIEKSDNDTTWSAYTTGMTGAGATGGNTMTWVVPMDAPSLLRYKSGTNAAMVNYIQIADGPVTEEGFTVNTGGRITGLQVLNSLNGSHMAFFGTHPSGYQPNIKGRAGATTTFQEADGYDFDKGNIHLQSYGTNTTTPATIKFEGGGSNNTFGPTISGPATANATSNYTITLPGVVPTANGQALTADTSGVCSWSTVDVKLDTPVITGDLEVADAGTVTHTITNWSDDVTYTFSGLSNCTLGAVNTSGQFVITETGDHPAYTVKAETDSLGLADSNTLTKQLKTRLSAPTLSSPADDGTATNIVYTITSTHANDNKLILDIGSSNFTYQSVSHGSGSKVGNTVEVTGFSTNNPAVTIQFTAEATYSVTAKAQDTGGTWGESVASAADSITIQNSYTVDFLVVAGGGGSGQAHGGGGGGGGFRASYNSETSGGGAASQTALQMVPGTAYTIDVGAAGTGGTFNATSGAASSISGSDITDITTVGGGKGASRSPNNAGSWGGSGGGGTDGHPGGPSGSGQPGTTGEGYAGGNGIYGSNHYNGGGGGGASQVGGNAQIGSPGGGPGGNGQSSTITGSSVTYAGGGGGGMGSGQGANTPGGSGGSGGGGSGGSDGGGQPGTNNLGGGGGGAGGGGYWGSTGGGRPGGTGVVILRMATANYSGTTSGSPTVTTDGSDTIVKFTDDGSYTA